MCYVVTKQHEKGNLAFHTKCRKCYECRGEKAREWGLRNALEAEENQIGCFLTLTYDEAHNPVVLLKEHLRDFKKRFRKHLWRYHADIKIKTFDCGEYGTLNFRPHFHILIHGFDFPDKYLDRQSDSGHNIYVSETLEKLWGKGLTTIQELTLNAAAYCALYAAKPTQELPEHLQRNPEFNTMSNNLGMKHILENMETYLLTDEIFYDGKRYRIPQTALNKYFGLEGMRDRRKKLGTIDPRDWERTQRYREIKEARTLKGEELWQAQHAQQNGNMEEVYDQKRYRAENKQKRLTKPL